MDKRVKHFVYKPRKPPFEVEKDAAVAFKKVFGDVLGSKVLDQLIFDMEYFRPDLPVSHEQMAFNAGKKYVISHILHAMDATYEKRQDLMSIDDDDY